MRRIPAQVRIYGADAMCVDFPATVASNSPGVMSASGAIDCGFDRFPAAAKAVESRVVITGSV
jgi:hypothetical protein